MKASTLLGLMLLLAAPLQAAEPLALVTVSASPANAADVADASVQAVRQSVLAAQVQGRVVALAVRAGDPVKAGQVLVRLDDREASATEQASQAAIQEARANLAKAQLDLQRAQSLARQNFVSAAAVDQARTQLKAQEARLESLRAGAGAAGAARSYAAISAPYDGVVAATQVEVGDMALPGKPLLTLFQPSALRVVAYLPEAALARLKTALSKGSAPTVEVGAQRWTGTRTLILPEADPSTHTTEVRIDLPATAQAAPGQFARVRFAGDAAPRLAIPATAIVRRGELTAVYVKTPAGAWVQRQIRAGERLASERIEVLAGLRVGEQLAADPLKASLLLAGQ